MFRYISIIRYSPDYSLNCTPLSPIIITYCIIIIIVIVIVIIIIVVIFIII